MEHFTGGVMISRLGVGFTPRQVSKPLRPIPPELFPYYELMVRLPFGDDIQKDFPQFSQMSWSKWDLNISSISKTKTSRTLDIMITNQGFMEVKVGSNGMVMEDKAYHEKLISVLRKENVEAMLYAGIAVLPFDPADGFGLWISRLDLNNITTRDGLVKLFAYLKEN